MDNKEFLKSFIKEVKRLPGFGENDTHIYTHCPSCEVNRESNRKGHLYISIVKEGHPLNCKKCSLSSSKLTVDLLHRLGINNYDLIKYVSENFKTRFSHIVNIDERNKKLNYSVITNTTKSDKNKLSRLSDRLLHDFDNEEDVSTYRIITNLSKFLKKNNIDTTQFNKKELARISIIDKYYLGFLSYFGNIISFRNMLGDETKYPRYITFKVNKELNRSFFYCPAIPIDPLAENPKITIAEGAIDIISIHLNNKCFDNNDNIYVASSSIGAFRSTIKNALSLTGYFGAEIRAYLDNEDFVSKISDFDFKKICNILRGFGKDFKVIGIMNLSDKDFGDLTKDITIGKCNLTNMLI